jgi:hypothetical protein
MEAKFKSLGAALYSKLSLFVAVFGLLTFAGCGENSIGWGYVPDMSGAYGTTMDAPSTTGLTGNNDGTTRLYAGDTLDVTIHLVNNGDKNVTDEVVTIYVTNNADGRLYAVATADYKGGGNYVGKITMDDVGSYTVKFETSHGVSSIEQQVIVL